MGFKEVPAVPFGSDERFEYWYRDQLLVWATKSYGALIISDRWSVFIADVCDVKWFNLPPHLGGWKNRLIETDEEGARAAVLYLGERALTEAGFLYATRRSNGRPRRRKSEELTDLRLGFVAEESAEHW